MDKMHFSIAKSFGRLQLIPESNGLRLWYIPNVNGQLAPDSVGACDILLPLEAVGGLWATARAFLYGVESLDENIIIRAPEGDVLVKLYRDKPKGSQGSLSGEEITWLRIVSGRSEDERRRIKLGPRDLLCIELACNAVLVLSASPVYHAAAIAPQPNGAARPVRPADPARTAEEHTHN
ncbi:MAG: hypothetical protein U0136_16910 [Bdellovibrionota bacterium]